MRHQLNWEENGRAVTGTWITDSHLSPPKRVVIADDTLKADTFYRAASEGMGFLWRGDFQNAKQLLQAVGRRIDKQASAKRSKSTAQPGESFHRYRQAQAHRAQLLSKLLVPVEANLSVPLSRAPDAQAAIGEAIQPQEESFLLSLKDLMAFIGAHEWRKKGVPIATLGARIHPYYGTFSPVRGEYLELIQTAPLPKSVSVAFDIGTGTGVIAALLAKRGIAKVIGTDLSDAAIACARENIGRLGLSQNVEVVKADMFPDGRADLIVCNPPWIPAKATSPLEKAVYDEDSRMLRGFLIGVANHLAESGEAWLIISNLAENLGLRGADEISTLIEKAGLRIIERLEIKPKHGKAADQSNPLHEARAREITRLWRLAR